MTRPASLANSPGRSTTWPTVSKPTRPPAATSSPTSRPSCARHSPFCKATARRSSTASLRRRSNASSTCTTTSYVWDALSTTSTPSPTPPRPIARSAANVATSPISPARPARDLAAAIDAHQHHLRLELTPAPTWGDPVRLRQIVNNLLTNAIKHTPDGGDLEIRTYPDTATGTVNLSVSDNGPGIDPADRPQVFERFYRAPRSRTTAGSGIGLAVVDQLVRAHRGTTRIVARQPGTTIEVALPSLAHDESPTDG